MRNDVAATVPTVARATFHHASHSVFDCTAVPPTPLVRFEATNARPPSPGGGPALVTAGRADPAELPIASERGGDDLLRLARLRAHVVADRHVALDDRVPEGAEPVDLDLDDVARFHRPGVRRRAGQQHVAREQRDRARDVGDQVVHVPDHLVGVPVLPDLTVHPRLDPLAVEVPVRHQSRAERAQRVRALHPQHRAGIRVAEVVQAVVVGHGVAQDVPGGVLGCDVRRPAADHDRDLALVVEVLAPRWPHDVAAVCVQRRGRLVEVRGSGTELHAELGATALVVQMDADDLRGLDGREVLRLVDPDPAAVRSDQLVAVPRDRDGVAVPQDPSGLHVVARIGRDARAEGVHGPADTRGTLVDRAGPAVALLRRRAHDRVPGGAGQGRGAASRRRGPRRRRPGRRRHHLGGLAVVQRHRRRAPRSGPVPIQGVLRRGALHVARASTTRDASTSGSTRTSRWHAAGTRDTRRSSAPSG